MRNCGAERLHLTSTEGQFRAKQDVNDARRMFICLKGHLPTERDALAQPAAACCARRSHAHATTQLTPSNSCQHCSQPGHPKPSNAFAGEAPQPEPSPLLQTTRQLAPRRPQISSRRTGLPPRLRSSKRLQAVLLSLKPPKVQTTRYHSLCQCKCTMACTASA